MNNKLFNHLIIIINVLLLIELFINKTLIINTIGYSLNIWITSIIPSLFPIFIISELLINYNIINYIPNIIKNIFKFLFNINDNELTILLISLISGFPSSSVNTKIMYDKKLLNTEECNHILMFTHFGNPIFILTTIGLIFFNNESLGKIIFISSLQSANAPPAISITPSGTITDLILLSLTPTRTLPSRLIIRLLSIAL